MEPIRRNEILHVAEGIVGLPVVASDEACLPSEGCGATATAVTDAGI